MLRAGCDMGSRRTHWVSLGAQFLGTDATTSLVSKGEPWYKGALRGFICRSKALAQSSLICALIWWISTIYILFLLGDLSIFLAAAARLHNRPDEKIG